MLRNLAISPASRSGASYDSTILADSPVAFWPLNETSGTTATDATGNGHSGTYTGGFTLGQTGIGDGETSVNLNGSTGRITIPFASALNVSNGPFTVEAWVNLPAVTGPYGILTGGSFNTFYARINGGNFDVLADNAVDLGASTSSLSTSAWHYVVWSRASQTSNALYLDGVNVTPGTFASHTLVSESTTLYIGTSEAGTEWFAGDVAKVALYNKALTSTQVSNHFNAHTSSGAPVGAPGSVSTSVACARAALI